MKRKVTVEQIQSVTPGFVIFIDRTISETEYFDWTPLAAAALCRVEDGPTEATPLAKAKEARQYQAILPLCGMGFMGELTSPCVIGEFGEEFEVNPKLKVAVYHWSRAREVAIENDMNRVEFGKLISFIESFKAKEG